MRWLNLKLRPSEAFSALFRWLRRYFSSKVCLAWSLFGCKAWTNDPSRFFMQDLLNLINGLQFQITDALEVDFFLFNVLIQEIYECICNVVNTLPLLLAAKFRHKHIVGLRFDWTLPACYITRGSLSLNLAFKLFDLVLTS
jgi:hypothetical protein